MLQRRSGCMMVLLFFITFGIYPIYWFIKFNAEVREASGEGQSGCMHILLAIITFGIYVYVWEYQTAKRLHKLGGADNSVVVLVLSLFGLAIVSWVLLQSEANKLAK